MPEAVHVLLPRSDMRELLEEAGAGLADELAAEHFAAHERAVLYQSVRMRVLQSREGSGPNAMFARCAHHMTCACSLLVLVASLLKDAGEGGAQHWQRSVVAAGARAQRPQCNMLALRARDRCGRVQAGQF